MDGADNSMTVDEPALDAPDRSSVVQDAAPTAEKKDKDKDKDAVTLEVRCCPPASTSTSRPSLSVSAPQHTDCLL